MSDLHILKISPPSLINVTFLSAELFWENIKPILYFCLFLTLRWQGYFATFLMEDQNLAAYLCSSKIWWLCLFTSSTTRFAGDVGYRMAKNSIALYKDFFLWTMTSTSDTENEAHDILSQILRPFWTVCLSYFFRPQYVCFLTYLYVPLIPNPSGQLAERIVYIIPL